MKQDNQNEQAALRDILKKLKHMAAETRSSRHELQQAEAELKSLFTEHKVAQFTYEVESERVRRTHQDIDYILRSLDRQRKICLERLQEQE